MPSSDRPFVWLDGSNVTYSNWAPGEPNNLGDEHCVELQTINQMWNDMNCVTNRLAYICQVRKRESSYLGLIQFL